jgi:hypothetical protein
MNEARSVTDRLEEIATFAQKRKAMRVKIDGIEIDFDRSAFGETPVDGKAPNVLEEQANIYDGVCPCGCLKADHNPESGCAAGCSEEKCAGQTRGDAESRVTAGQYG